MNIVSLYYFVELAKELHVTNAAQKLYISQQNLSQHIRRLEQHYGVTLFHRKPKLALTYAGEQLFITAVKILSEEHDLMNRLSSISLSKTGNLKVGLPGYRGQICLPAILPRFYEKWPNITIDLINESSGKMEEMLLGGEMDLFIGIMYQDNASLSVTTILNDRIYLICSNELLERYFQDSGESFKRSFARGADLKSFSEVPFLLPKPPMKLRKTIDQCFQEVKITPRVFLESQTTELLISLYPYHYGAFFCTQMRLPMLLELYPDANALPLAQGNAVVQHRLVLAYHRERFLPECAHDFIEITKEVFDRISKVRPDVQQGY